VCIQVPCVYLLSPPPSAVTRNIYYPFSFMTSLQSFYHTSSFVPSIILPSIITLLLNPQNLSNPSRRPPLPFLTKRGSHGITALALYQLLDSWGSHHRGLAVSAVPSLPRSSVDAGPASLLKMFALRAKLIPVPLHRGLPPAGWTEIDRKRHLLINLRPVSWQLKLFYIL
jgi:hypothetical protein